MEENANITKKELENIQKAIWKAQEIIATTVNELHNPESYVDPVLLQEIASDYLKYADELIERYV